MVLDTGRGWSLSSSLPPAAAIASSSAASSAMGSSASDARRERTRFGRPPPSELAAPSEAPPPSAAPRMASIRSAFFMRVAALTPIAPAIWWSSSRSLVSRTDRSSSVSLMGGNSSCCGWHLPWNCARLGHSSQNSSGLWSIGRKPVTMPTRCCQRDENRCRLTRERCPGWGATGAGSGFGTEASPGITEPVTENLPSEMRTRKYLRVFRPLSRCRADGASDRARRRPRSRRHRVRCTPLPRPRASSRTTGTEPGRMCAS